MKFHVDSRNKTKKSETIVGFKDNWISIRKANSDNIEQDICHWESTRYETPLRFNISLREIFSKSGSPILMKKYDESAIMHISQEFGTA